MTDLPPQRHIFFLPGLLGPICAVYYPPAVTSHFPKSAVLHVPAFAEEMNKCRRMVVLQAEKLASTGYGVLVVDLYGTGDSGGEFRDARWEVWKADLDVALGWLRSHGAETIKLWGVRLGGLLALELALQYRDEIRHLMLWQPVVDGRSMLTQFLRLRLAADMMAGSKGERMATLCQRLAGGETVEVAGYELTPELATALERRSFASLDPPVSMAVDWLDVVPSAGRNLSPASQRMVETWRGRGVSVAAAAVVGEAFWTTQEIALAPRLLDETTGRLAA
ncbi:hydrolase, exosortase system type 1 associated [Nitrosococcus halophilus Nc 4]|uniref:Hydrolase, exosortase system type 1 associated n=1 Tax=Nitrosococcus halophilus (strain Nc4) TaxID=472759 RepID=D5C018_NITHN|nr:hydrolase 2, exosortase A system-associated [Nitrosococcus halophilus]ADE16265.1 hydrolase, exosortase system type 1 associated [Nitrosococcus halophilus Nc 4]